ncbi:MAG TPA: Ig-like domain-containing protein [Kofleriaceae bacterium]
MKLLLACLCSSFVGCASPDDIQVTLQPEVISSLSGSVSVHAVVYADDDAVGNDQTVDLSIAYTDRNGVAHMIAPTSAKTNNRGEIDATFTGLTWDGTGTVTAALGKLTGEAQFSVLDRSPPVVTIEAPAGGVVHTQTNTTVTVHVTDEIGLSSVTLQASADLGGNGRQRTAIFSGSTDEMVQFDFGQVQNTQVGQSIMLYAMAADLSGNLGVATPIAVTVAQ